MNRRTLLSRTTPLAAATALAACANQEAPAPSQSAEPATIRWTPGGGAAAQQLAESFNKRFNDRFAPRITAAGEVLPAASNKEQFERWVTMAVAGQLPEIVALSGSWSRPFILKNLTLDLTPFIRRERREFDPDDFYKGSYESGAVQGKQYCLPPQININSLFLNKNHLQEASLAFPSDSWTPRQFLDYAVKLTRRGGASSGAPAGPGAETQAGASTDGGTRWGFDMPFTALDRNVTWIWNHGGQPHDPKDGPLVTKLTYDDPKTVEGLRFLHDLIWSHRVSPVTNDQRGGLSREDAFLNGRVSFYFNASGNAGMLRQRGAATGLDWDFAPLVKGPGGYGGRASVGGYLVAGQTAHREQAWTVIRELVSKENQVEGAKLQGLQPSRKSVADAWEQLYPGKNARIARLMAETAPPDPRSFWKDGDEVGPILEGKYMEATLTRNELPVQEAMRRAMAEIRSYYTARP